MHFVLRKKKVLLDQLREGLKTLGVLEEAIKHPLLFEKLFVKTESDLVPGEVKAILKFPEQMGVTEVETREMLLQFIDDCSIDSKERFFVVVKDSLLNKLNQNIVYCSVQFMKSKCNYHIFFKQGCMTFFASQLGRQRCQ